ncbi:MAG: nitroreductase family protein [Tepidiformaceae bacterium]
MDGSPALIPALRERRARRAFAARAVPPEGEAILWEAFAVAPSHGNAQPARLLVARAPAVREALVAALSAGNRQWAPAAPLLVALGALPSHDTVQTGSDGATREYWAFHAGIAAGNVMAQATALGLIAHPMAGFDEAAVRATFGAPPELRVLAVLAIGYPGEPDALPADLRERETTTQQRLPLNVLVADDAWDEENGTSAKALRGAAPAKR